MMPMLCSIFGVLFAAVLAVMLLRSALDLRHLPGDRRGRRRLREELMFHARLCPHCGYDTRASPTRCSECGRELGPGTGGAGLPVASAGRGVDDAAHGRTDDRSSA